MTRDLRQVAETLREFALRLPAAEEAYPWGEHVVKVNKKIFLFLGVVETWDTHLPVCVKLPQTGVFALTLPFVEPSGYRPGKHGWVTAQLTPDAGPRSICCWNGWRRAIAASRRSGWRPNSAGRDRLEARRIVNWSVTS